ncbi:MAG: phosphoketolase family protein, partial [Candidatus Eremiobacteraeota bacterium]|nr:phosphoketolase family protein [Candidatus Eremiobacteraeota bacterium]
MTVEVPVIETTSAPALSAEEAHALDAYWRAANYLSVGQIYLLANPLLREPLRREHLKPRLLGHWGTTPGLNFVYVHLNRLIRRHGVDVLYVAGPGHGGPGLVANTYLEGTYSELYTSIPRNEAGLQRLMKQFSFPGGVGSHATAETPGSIHEGGELGYSLVHAHGAAFDDPDLLVACVVGDGEAETGPLATSWHANKFVDPVRDGAVLPILHLNGYKIANPTVLARIPRDELLALLHGYGYEPFVVEGDDPALMHPLMASTLETVYTRIREIQRDARERGVTTRPRWPMIVLVTPKGWTGPKVVDGVPIEGTFRAHQVPLADFDRHPEHLAILEAWMRSYKPEELFDANGTFVPELAALAPTGEKRMGASTRANGGLRLHDLNLPDFRDYAVGVTQPGAVTAESTRVLGTFLRDVIRANMDRFRLFGPDETASNRLDAVFEATNREWTEYVLPSDDHLALDGRVFEVLSEHLCEGWLEGYLLTGRHGFFSCYEAFIHIVDSMLNQHAKWLKVSKEVPWRRPIASLNYLLTSHVWRQDHNGFSHQDPGFLDHVVNKKADVVRVYLPPDANTLLSVADHCLRSKDYINVIVAGKQPEAQWLSIDDAIRHCTKGVGIWDFASNDDGIVPDVVMACCGDVPTQETLAAVDFLREHVPDLKMRVINVVDLMTLEPDHPHGLTDADFDALFTTDRPVVFAFHGYPWLVHRLTYRRNNHDNMHVRGYIEEGTTTTPFDMTVRNH